MEKFLDIVYKYSGDNVEVTEQYCDCDAARADFIYMAQDHSEDYEYVILREVETDYCDCEEITVLEEYYKED